MEHTIRSIYNISMKKEYVMRRLAWEMVFLFFLVMPAMAQTADEIIAKYIKAVGGMEKIQAVTSLRRTGKFIGGGGFEATVVSENKRSNMVRREFAFQGLTGISAYDGKMGWKIEPWSGKKDPESLGEGEMKDIVEDADFDGPLVNYHEKGNKVEYLGLDPVEGTDAIKLKVTLANGDVLFYYMDTDYYVPIKIEIERFIRGEEQDYEIILGDYKEVAGWYLPFSLESGAKGSPDKGKITYDKIESNITIDDGRFAKPVSAGGSEKSK